MRAPWPREKARLDGLSDLAAQHGKRIAVRAAVGKGVSSTRVTQLRQWLDTQGAMMRIAMVDIGVPVQNNSAGLRALSTGWPQR